MHTKPIKQHLAPCAAYGMLIVTHLLVVTHLLSLSPVSSHITLGMVWCRAPLLSWRVIQDIPFISFDMSPARGQAEIFKLPRGLGKLF